MQGTIITCPYCNQESKFVTSKQFYGKDYGTNVYVCYPCDAYVGTHGRGKTPLGTMANRELREMRKRAHATFDPLWKGKKKIFSRSGAYRWLQRVMEVPAEKAHIGMFNERQCWELIKHAKEMRN